MTINKAALRSASIAAVILAASCAAPMNNGQGVTNDPAANHPITVEPHFTSIKVPFSAPQAGLMPDDAAKFDAFVADYLSRGSGSISVSAPVGPYSAAALDYFGQRLFSMGVPRSSVLVGTHQGDGQVEIGFIAYSAHTAACGDWSENLGDTSSNRAAKNFGCAVQNNIAAQVADPRDLVEMRASEPADATRRAAVIQNYEQGKVTSAQKSQDQSGAVSDVNRN
ncbi:MAG TPA: CpaD family pilus assembly protein [Rhizomicrobium sp.]|nr:CpaD family pilus assembly protein [Rhizomicrobium sp.]